MGRALHFRIGIIPITLETEFQRFQDEFLALYGRYLTEDEQVNSLRFQIVRHRKRPWSRQRYLILGGREGSFAADTEEEVLPHLEWAINWHIALYWQGFYQIHASIIQCGQQAVLFPGVPGSGKTTLSAAMLAWDARYYSDEIALIDPRTLLVHPYPKCLCIKQGAVPLLKSLFPHLALEPTWIKRTKGAVCFLDPWKLSNDPIASPQPIRYVLFPSWSPGSAPALQPITRAEAMFDLTRYSFNFLNYKNSATRLLANIVREAECFRIQAGDLNQTCRLVVNLVQR
ncbi:MAG: hypothetical protein AB1898_19315 [Acidobacteriota bacterium]